RRDTRRAPLRPPPRRRPRRGLRGRRRGRLRPKRGTAWGEARTPHATGQERRRSARARPKGPLDEPAQGATGPKQPRGRLAIPGAIGAASGAALAQVLLVVLLRLPEGGGGDDLGDDGRAEAAGALVPLLGGPGGRLLLGRMEEDGRTILRAHVRPLAVRRGRIVAAPEHAQQLLVADALRIVGHLHRLGVPGGVGAD